MALNYGDTSIPSDSYSVTEGGSVQIAAAFERSVGLVGGMDTANGTATEGEVTAVSSTQNAGELFGDDSELYYQCNLAFSNGATEVYAVPVPETEETESFSTTSSGQLSNVPFFNPEIHNDHDITAQDTSEAASVDVNIVYTDGAPSAPTESNTINLDYVTGQFTADESSSYDITYTYGDYSTSVITELLTEGARQNAVLSEHSTPIDDLDTELQDDANAFNFGHGIGGVTPFEDSDNPDTSNYTDSYDSERISVVSSPYWYVDDARTNLQRAHGAVAGELASLPLGVSGTKNKLNGLVEPRTNFTPAQAADLIDEQVLPLINYPPATIIKDMTTSTTTKFERVYTMDVVDEVVTQSHDINNDYVGEQTTRVPMLERAHKNLLKGLTNTNPPLLHSADGPAYTVDAEIDDVNQNHVNLDLAIDVVGVIDAIKVDITVGDIVEAEVS